MIPSNGTVFADYLSCTTPIESHETVVGDVLPLLDEIGCLRDSEGLYRKDSGTVSLGTLPKRGIGFISATGQVLAALRAHDLLGQFLHAIGQVPHRVTRLDASQDFPVYAPPVLATLYKLASNGSVKLTRKKVRPKKIFSPLLYEGPSSHETGTVYLGGRKAEVSLAAYDKRQELLEKTGVDIGEDRLRLECRIKDGMSPSLRDAFEPSPIFHRFVQPSIVSGYVGPSWVSTVSEGFAVSRRDLPLGQRLKSVIESSPDLARVAALVAEGGPPMLDLALHLLAKRIGSSGVLLH